METKIVKDSIQMKDLKSMAQEQFGDLVKAAVDIEQKIMAIGGELHADQEVLLMEKEGSNREHTWGINLYPEKQGEEFIEFDSMINVKPIFGNRSRTIESSDIRKKIQKIVTKIVTP
jgi:hypothetical protein